MRALHARYAYSCPELHPALIGVRPFRAESANVVLLNEIGLDPGIDHCSALSLLRQLEKENKRVLSFTSFCGGLPAPEASDVPLGYKFSWSPRGVLNAALNGARFKLNGQVYTRLISCTFLTRDPLGHGDPWRECVETSLPGCPYLQRVKVRGHC